MIAPRVLVRASLLAAVAAAVALFLTVGVRRGPPPAESPAPTDAAAPR